MYERFNWTITARRRNRMLKEHEPLQPYMFVELMTVLGCETFIDVGANIGAYSIFISALTSVKTIYAFEAAPATFPEMNANIALNNLQDRITTFGLAVSDRPGTVKFGVVNPYSGCNGVLETSFQKPDIFQKAVEIPCVALDDTIHERGQTIGVKIDVEGHERHVLLGARELLTGNRAFLQLENYSAGEADPLAPILEEYGYKKITTIGPDAYYSNIPAAFEPALIIAAFESASAAVIASNRKPQVDVDEDRPIFLRLPGENQVRLQGPLAVYARTQRNKLRSRT